MTCLRSMTAAVLFLATPAVSEGILRGTNAAERAQSQADGVAEGRRSLEHCNGDDYKGLVRLRTPMYPDGIFTSCFQLDAQRRRSAIIPDRCTHSLIGMQDVYGVASTVSDACPNACGECDTIAVGIEDPQEKESEGSNDGDEKDGSNDVVIPSYIGEEDAKYWWAVSSDVTSDDDSYGFDDDEYEYEDDDSYEYEEHKPAYKPPAISNTEGGWGQVFDMELISIHAMLTPDGRVISYGSSNKGRQGGGLYYETWNLQKGIHQDEAHELLKHNTNTDIFCSSLNVDTSTGNIIIMGGDVGLEGKRGPGIDTVLEYNTSTQVVRHHPRGDMHYERWYGISINLPNGDIFVVGGRDGKKLGSPIPELWSPSWGFRELSGAIIPQIAAKPKKNFWWYPHAFVNSKGQIIVIMPRGDDADIYLVSVHGKGDIKRTGTKPFMAHVRSPSIMFRTDQVLFLDDIGDMWVADISNGSSVEWKLVNKIGHSRTNASMAILPDGRVAIVGGCKVQKNGGSVIKDAAKNINIWDPVTNDLYRGEQEVHPRLYHSSALILPDGRLFSGGGGAPGPVRNLNGQLYTPDYLVSKNVDEVARPTIWDYPKNIRSGESFVLVVDDASRIAKVTATKSGSSSHTRNCDTRWLDLNFELIDSTTLRVFAQDGNIMIGGLWLASVLDINGVPSEAKLIGVNMVDLV